MRIAGRGNYGKKHPSAFLHGWRPSSRPVRSEYAEVHRQKAMLDTHGPSLQRCRTVLLTPSPRTALRFPAECSFWNRSDACALIIRTTGGLPRSKSPRLKELRSGGHRIRGSFLFEGLLMLRTPDEVSRYA